MHGLGDRGMWKRQQLIININFIFPTKSGFHLCTVKLSTVVKLLLPLQNLSDSLSLYN